MIRLNGVTVTLGGKQVVQDVSAQCASGTLSVIVGPNGAGKTSLLRAIAGLAAATGSVTIGGRPLGALSLHERAKCIGYLPQGHQLHWPLSAETIVALGRYPHGLADPARLDGAHRVAVERAMASTGVTALRARSVTTLSGGERARVALARVMAAETPIVLADEPTAALDPRYQLEVFTVLRQLAGQGVTLIAVTHDLTLAARFADTIWVMDEGRLVTSGPAETALSDSQLAEVFHVAAKREGGVVVPWRVLP